MGMGRDRAVLGVEKQQRDKSSPPQSLGGPLPRSTNASRRPSVGAMGGVKSVGALAKPL